MTDIEHLINMTLEMEGLLRTLRDRDNVHARELLLEKARAYAALVEAAIAAPELTPVVTAPVNSKSDDVKFEEAETEEVAQEEELAEVAVAKEMEKERKEIHFPSESAPRPTASVIPVQLSKAFTLNDRFRFKRELFNGNDEDFTDTIQLLSDMETYGEAEDYLLNDMMWDKENPAVADFLSILANNMSNGTR